MTDGHVSRLTVRLITGMYKCTCVCLYRSVCGGASAAQFGGCSMHLASDVDDLLTRPSASTEPAAAALQSVKSERGRSSRRSLAPNPAHSLTNTHIYMINTSTTVDFQCSAANKNSAKGVISTACSTIQEECRGQRDISLPVMSPESVTASE